MDARLISTGKGVPEILHALWQRAVSFLQPESHKLMASLLVQGPEDVDVLPRKALMDEQQLHGSLVLAA